MGDIETSLNDLHNLLETFPSHPRMPKSLMEIAGFPRWEASNSNILAFYFDQTEEHGFGRLFLDALLDVLQEKIVYSEHIPETWSEYRVERETSNIDLLLYGPQANFSTDAPADWAVIIENKLFHQLNNPLEKYWNAVCAQQKTGVVLSLFNLPIPTTWQNRYVNILHRELIEAVKKRLHTVFMEANTHYLALLKDYFYHIESFYMQESAKTALDKSLRLYQEQIQAVKNLRKIEEGLWKYAMDEVSASMGEFGFTPNNSWKTKARYYFSDETWFTERQLPVPRYFRIWFWSPSLLEENMLELNFELQGTYATKALGDSLTERLGERNIRCHLTQGHNTRGQGFYHIARIKAHLLEIGTKTSLKSAIKQVLQGSLFASEKHNFVVDCTNLLEIILNEKP